MRLLAGTAILILCAAAVCPAQGDDLAALARKERERRAKVAKPAKVLTEDDSKESAATGGSLTVIPNAPANSQTPEGTVAPNDGGKQVWKDRADVARRILSSAQEALHVTEVQIETVRNDLAPLDAAAIQDPMRLQKRDAKLFELKNQADQQRLAITAAKKAISDLEDEARRSNIPAGWLR